MEKKKYSIKEDMSLLAILLIPISVAINIVGGQLTNLLKLPVFLNTIGTMLSGILAGPWIGALTGLVTNLVQGIILDPNIIPMAIVNMAVGIASGYCSRSRMFSNAPKSILALIIITFSSILTSTPLIVILRGGITASSTSLLTAFFLATGQRLWTAVFSQQIIFTTLDRVISILIVFLIIKVIPTRNLIKFSCGENYIKQPKTNEAA